MQSITKDRAYQKLLEGSPLYEYGKNPFQLVHLKETDSETETTEVLETKQGCIVRTSFWSNRNNDKVIINQTFVPGLMIKDLLPKEPEPKEPSTEKQLNKIEEKKKEQESKNPADKQYLPVDPEKKVKKHIKSQKDD